jgi:hypothetical protein
VWFGGSTPPSPLKSIESFDKAKLSSQFYGKYICNNLIRICVSFISKFRETPDLRATAPRYLFSRSTLFPELKVLNPPKNDPGFANAEMGTVIETVQAASVYE